MYMTIRSWTSLIMEVIGPEVTELAALELEKFATLYCVYTLASANTDQSVPNFAMINIPIRSRMSSIVSQMELEHPELFALEFGKIAEYDFVFTLSSTNINQSAPNLVQMYMNTRSQMSLVMDVIRQELSELSALELENLPYLTLFTLQHLQILTNQYQTWLQYICP